ncbi:MAG: hypothetical protein Q8R70_00725, partial [Methanoregula sp.]|nr:hypothetical protein [Methanoregula sp.]
MGFKEDIQKLAIQVNENKQYITNEETTKHSLIIPFIQVLGYDVFNPREVKPEFDSDFGKKKGTKVDYAIFKDEKPIIFVEAKPVVTVYIDTRAIDGMNGSPLNASLIDARTGRSFFRTVEIYPLIRQ